MMAAPTLCSPFAVHSRPWLMLFPAPWSQLSPSLLFCMHKEAVSYILRIEGRPYTIHLQQHCLGAGWDGLPSHGRGSLSSLMSQGGCHYWGYIDGFPRSAVTLDTCSGLRGLLQFENVSYGIQPLGRSPVSQHVLYRNNFSVPTLTCFTLVGTLSALVSSWVVFQYNYMGSDPNAATQNIIQAFNLINNMFNPLNVTIVLSSLELWAEGDKISTAGDIDDLLQRFLRWKQLSMKPQAHNIASLLGYRERGSLVGTAAPGEACQRDAAATVALYCGNVTLESFSVLLAQVLGHSLGMSSDSPRGCSCPGRVCTMSPEALHFSGMKSFSNCSIRDFQTFLRQGRSGCLFGSPRLSRGSRRSAAVCGNRVVEPGEQCDCGTECLKDKCCTNTCRLKPKARCASGLCCRNCQFKRRNSLCRPAADAQCDLTEFCSGSSASCPPDVYVQDGHECGYGTGYCYQGRCQSSDLHCKRLYGRDSKNAPRVCYEEINGQRDRFGHCGVETNRNYRHCTWRDLRCGKLICTYPSYKPFSSSAAAVIYARVRHHLCVSLNYLNVPMWLDPLLVPPGTKCGTGRVMKYSATAHLYPWLALQVCNNKGNCHCHPGWQPPDCRRRGSRWGGSRDSGLQLTEGGEWGSRGDGVGWAGSARAWQGWQCLCPAGLAVPGRAGSACARQGWQCPAGLAVPVPGSACARQGWQCLCPAGLAVPGRAGSACARQGWQCLCLAVPVPGRAGSAQQGWQCPCPAGLAVPVPGSARAQLGCLPPGLQRALEDGEMAWLVLGSSLVLLLLTAALGLGLWRQQLLDPHHGEGLPGTQG
uniref:ADAM metallopeptidase domain 32 n=1 Tax=Taeniopygia guttata TaxID=59729 RepID=H0Z403_TAEGU